MFRWLARRLGPLHILVANAGILTSGAVDDFPADRWRTVIDVNLNGYFLCAKHAASVMKEQYSGVIIQINSKSGKKGSYKNAAYAASKFGGIGLTQSIALELVEHGVRVNAVCPGWVRTDMGGPNAELGVVDGARGIVWAATLPDDGPSGGFFRHGEEIDW